MRTAFEAGRACDTRVLYQLAKGVREKPAAVGPLLAGDAPLTRDVVETALREPRDSSAAEEASSSRRIEGSKLARALLVEHAGRRGRLGWKGQPGRRTGQVQFDDGSRQTVELSELKLVAWSAR